MNDPRSSERLIAVAGLLTILAAGLPVLLETLRAGGERLVGPAWAWWACYLAYLAVFVLESQHDPERRPPWLGDRVLLSVQVVLGLGAVVLAPAFGWSAVLLVVSAVSATYIVSRRTLRARRGARRAASGHHPAADLQPCRGAASHRTRPARPRRPSADRVGARAGGGDARGVLVLHDLILHAHVLHARRPGTRSEGRRPERPRAVAARAAGSRDRQGAAGRRPRRRR